VLPFGRPDRSSGDEQDSGRSSRNHRLLSIGVVRPNTPLVLYYQG
jgi:hypothetical protein